jgi:hypothetical protein
VRDGNLLAASVARELIDCGVRCVVVAGWAVDDQGALVFGNAFYRHPAGRAAALWRGGTTKRARRSGAAIAQDITWGAFQAYGDPGWRAEPRLLGNNERDSGYASPEELLGELASRRVNLSRGSDRHTRRAIDAEISSLRGLLKDRCPAGWRRLPIIQSALGAIWSDLGELEEARTSLIEAIQSEDSNGQVPMRAIEQLANIEARLGEKTENEAMIQSALARLEMLDRLLGSAADQARDPGSAVNAERSALRGSAAKRLASLHARRLLAAGNSSEPGQRQVDEAAAAAMTSGSAAKRGFIIKRERGSREKPLSGLTMRSTAWRCRPWLSRRRASGRPRSSSPAAAARPPLPRLRLAARHSGMRSWHPSRC